MKNIRLGNDIQVKWTLLSNDNDFYFHEDYSYKLYLKNNFEKREVDFTISDNIIEFTFLGKEQKHIGRYSLTLVINEGEVGMVTVDSEHFVNLVICSCNIPSGSDIDSIETQTIEFESNVGVTQVMTLHPDWNASEGEIGYIKNRTHYETAQDKTIYQSVCGYGEIVGYDDIYGVEVGIDGFYDNEGREREVRFLGLGGEYETKWQELYTTGRLVFYGKGANPDYGYGEITGDGYEDIRIVSIFRGQSGYTEALEISNPYNVGLVCEYREKPVVTPLGERFIPDTIARKSELTELSEELASNWVMIEELQNTKIDKEADDYYPQLSVGTADNLSGVDEVDSEFSFRRSGGGAIADGVARVQSIKGNSVVWNQLNEKFYFTEDRAIACREGVAITKGHKYLLLRTQTNGGFYLIPKADFYDYSLANGVSYKFFTSEIDCVSSGVMTTYPHIYCTAESGYVQIVNLTQMFGAGNEPSTIEEYNARKPFVEDEYAYNEGEVIHMTAEGISSKGVNAWDEQWEEGAVESDGSINSEAYRRTTSYIRVLPNEEYFLACPESAGFGRYAYYDANYTLIKVEITEGYPANKKFTTPSGASYLRITLGSGYGTTYNHDICIGISGDWDGYHAPIEASEDLSIVAKYFPNGMRSAGAAHDEIRYNKQTNKWEKVVRVGEVSLDSLAYYSAKDGEYSLSIPTGYKAETSYSAISNITCIYASTSVNDANANARDKCIYGVDDWLIVRDSAFSTLESFKAAMQGVMLYYELAEPIVTEIKEKDFNLDYSVWNCGTEQMVASKPSSALSADITYGFNAVGLIKQLRSMLEALSAKVANL